MFFGNALRGYISYTKQKAVTYQHQIHTDPRNSCKSIPLNTTRNKECSLRWLEISFLAVLILIFCSPKSVTAPGAHARMNTGTCFVQNASLIEAPTQQQWHQVPSSDESSPFPTGAPKGPTHPCCPFPKVQAFCTSGHTEETRDRGQCGCLA